MKVDRLSRASIVEHLAVECDLDLQEFCMRLQTALGLPEFHFDGENLTEWGLVEVEHIEYNISRPYESSMLQKWDQTVPLGCNLGVTLILSREHPHAGDPQWSFTNLVTPIGQIIADEFEIDVHYHRTWLGADQNVERKVVFCPNAA